MNDRATPGGRPDGALLCAAPWDRSDVTVYGCPGRASKGVPVLQKRKPRAEANAMLCALAEASQAAGLKLRAYRHYLFETLPMMSLGQRQGSAPASARSEGSQDSSSGTMSRDAWDRLSHAAHPRGIEGLGKGSLLSPSLSGFSAWRGRFGAGGQAGAHWTSDSGHEKTRLGARARIGTEGRIHTRVYFLVCRSGYRD